MPRQTWNRTVTLSDFSPGIWSQGNYASTVPPAPFGAAQESNTYRCVALPGGGLGPLPKLNSTVSVPWVGAGTTGTFVGIQALRSFKSSVTAGATDIVTVFVDTDTSPRRLYLPVYDSLSNTWTTAGHYQTAPGFPTTGVSGATFLTLGVDPPRGISTVIGGSSYGGSNPPYASDRFVAFSNPNTNAATSPGTIRLFTTDVTPNIRTGVTQYLDGAGRTSLIFSHQGRLVSVVRFGAVNSQVTNINSLSSEAIFYYPVLLVDPTTFAANGTQKYLGVDNGQVFGSGGSISVGELLLVSAEDNGSVLISGDLSNPTVTLLRGIQPTGGTVMNGLQSNIGLIYCSEKNGAWLWNGGNLSIKVSPQIRDNFFDRTTDTGAESLKLTNGTNLTGAVWNNFVLFPNNFTFDTDSKSWWRIEDTSVFNSMLWTHHSGLYCYGLVDSMQSGTTNTLAIFKWGIPATSWSWQSHPISISDTPNQMVQVREMELKGVATASGQTFTVTLTNADGTTQPETFTLGNITDKPQRLRLGTRMQGWDIIVRIEANGNGSAAPILHSLTLMVDDGPPTGLT